MKRHLLFRVRKDTSPLPLLAKVAYFRRGAHCPPPHSLM